MTCLVDNRRRRMVGALRKWRRDALSLDAVETLYLPDRTVWLSQRDGSYVVEDVDEHRLGQVPVVMFLNRPRVGNWHGTSEMADVIGMTDGIARLITNMLIAAETHAVPDKWAIGVSRGDFVDDDGNPLPTWETYFTAIKATANTDARFGQFQPSTLDNFHASVNNMLAWCASVLGLPTRYAGQIAPGTSIPPPTATSANWPSSAGCRARRPMCCGPRACRWCCSGRGRPRCCSC